MHAEAKIALAAVVFVANAAYGQAEPEHFSSREYGIYFDVPAGWTLDRKPESGLLALRDSLGLVKVSVAARIIAKRKDVRELAKATERARGWGGKGVSVATLLKDPGFPEAKRGALESFLYDDTERTDKARKEYEEAEAKRPVDIKGDGSESAGGSIPDDREFLAGMTTRLYEAEDLPETQLVFFIIGGGVGYTVTVSALRDDFFAVLPLAHDVIAAMKLDRLSGGRYVLPDAKALAAAKKGIIMGKVLSNGRAVGGAAVNLYADSATHSKGIPTHQSRSDGYGEYFFTQLEAGRYYMLEVYGVSDEGVRVRSVQPITNIDVVEGNVVFVNIEVSRTP